MEIRIRYVWKRLSDGHIYLNTAPIECVEGDGDVPFILQDHSLWELVSRDLFTGLKDSKGVEIYEGDIVKYPYEGDWDDPEFWEGVVEFEAGLFSSDSGNQDLINDKIEVIGNKYEDEDLL